MGIELPDRPEIAGLIADLNAYLLSLYRPEECHHLTIEELKRPEVVFFTARRGEEPVACGALRMIGEGLGEVKRMYVAPSEQGRGLGRKILEAIEWEARARGLAALVLETGHAQPAALGLYRSAGFSPRGPYLDYPDNGVSIFMEKRLSD
ncbi:GNAT family N-acetyltransferase [Afifella sp. IM 167]|nr:GNAT family N-acetyltransferase [Afifella sp. IM 167]